MVKIGAELPKLSQKYTGYPFFGPPCMCWSRFVLYYNTTTYAFRWTVPARYWCIYSVIAILFIEFIRL